MTLHQLTELKTLESSSDFSATTTLKHMRNDKARADKILKDILALIPPSSSEAVIITVPTYK